MSKCGPRGERARSYTCYYYFHDDDDDNDAIFAFYTYAGTHMIIIRL